MSRLHQWVKDHPGLVVLLVTLTIISVQTVKPGFFLIGWDNYSSYFQPGINIFRTLFATWRDYRGLGVASDAEVTDVFRQLLFMPLSFVLPRELLDQTYYLLALWLGVLGMYTLAGLITNELPSLNGASSRKKDIFGCITALFYLFNLNTLSVFYSPIIPFTNRFFSLPLTLAVFVWFWQSKHSWRRFLVLAITVIVTSGSYITPTVIITSLMALGIFVLFRSTFKQTVVCGFVFLALNAFWLLPFVNYTREKASIVPLARTFVEINESTLNAHASSFSLAKQVVLTPSFFDLQFKTIDSGNLPIHPQLGEFTKPPYSYFLFLFPFLYIIGSLVLIAGWKKNKHLLWIPVWIVLFLFLSMKEFGPMGWLYAFLKEHTPLFGVVFRIADTKFHAYVSLAGSIAAACAIVWSLSLLRKKALQRIATGAFLLLAIPYVWLFRGFASGNLIGPLAFARLPTAYKEIAAAINAAPGDGRVLHLPMDQWHSYWRSFSWGYVGSSFFHYLINKPYIDKTFEPASMENAYLHEEIGRLIDAFYRSNNSEKKKLLGQQFLRLLRKTGIAYVILDESISSSVYPKNLAFGAKQYYVQARDLIAYLAEGQDAGIVRAGAYTVDRAKLDVFEVLSAEPAVRRVAKAQNIDPGIADSFSIVLDQSDARAITQNFAQPAALMPFRQQNHVVARQDGSFTIRYDNPNPPLSYRVRVPASDSYMVDVYGRRAGGNLMLRLYHRYLPDINGRKFAVPAGSIVLPLPKETKEGRIMLNDVFLSLPNLQSDSDGYIGSFMLHEKTIHASLLEEVSVVPATLSSFRETEPLSCFGTPARTYEGKTSIGQDSLRLTAKSGSSCLRGQFTVPSTLSGKRVYAEIEAVLGGSDEAQVYLCMREGSVDDCLNSHRVMRFAKDSSSLRFPLRSLIQSAQYSLDIGVVNPTDTTQTLGVKDVRYHLYQAGAEKTLDVVPYAGEETVTISGPLELLFPKAASAYSYFHDPKTDGFYVPLDSCRGEHPAPRIIRYTKDRAVSRMVNCSTHFAQWFRYAPDRPYLFSYSYLRRSGQQPSIVMGRDGDNYFFERASLWQGYPDLHESLAPASRFIDPLFYADSAPADTAMHLFQDTANTGIMEVGNFDMMEYPAGWRDLSLAPVGYEREYPTGEETLITTQIFPSLWKVSGALPAGSMIAFNRGFDRQWGIFDSFWGVLFGKSLAPSVRCQGYANCFALSGSEKKRDLYLFYTPERLSLLGWLGTAVTMVSFLIVLRMRSTRSS